MERPGAAERVANLRKEVLADIGLYELRRSHKVSQVELASRLQITQPAISQLENAADPRLSTLRDYIEALGGQLELCAHFNGEMFSLDVGEDSDVTVSR